MYKCEPGTRTEKKRLGFAVFRGRPCETKQLNVVVYAPLNDDGCCRNEETQALMLKKHLCNCLTAKLSHQHQVMYLLNRTLDLHGYIAGILITCGIGVSCNTREQ
ncbi:uncharacterized protein PHALS_09049 [Plasmopara halstedii]|uniref:Uncharacterized protein n=1 Tax=Plasmopara halstedii TaxID=4781 RepID=A0A0P1A4X8_PLAHL|nr:uncharacterized protein PHALS_09049 [Plasmopara halstedii]CEG35237.1 hypothetical protein PHALS_09049 [Plasmopara halstedii]|eukprot:XP_024571606.1 hypothetical protein PHALS_09049 [Plasmopara halstedii]